MGNIIPETPLSDPLVSLVAPKHGYRQLAQDPILHMLLPQSPVHPNAKFYVPVFVDETAGGAREFNGSAEDDDDDHNNNQQQGIITAITIRYVKSAGILKKSVKIAGNLKKVA